MLKICAIFLTVILCAAAADKTPLSDAAIRDQVMIHLSNDPQVRGGELKVEVQNGVATITGSVDEKKRKEKATSVARKVKGVKSVVNQITVKEKNPGK